MMTVAGLTRAYAVTYVNVAGNDAAFYGVCADGARLNVVVEDNGTPGAGLDRFRTAVGMLVTDWTVTDGNLVVRSR
ncbi:MAG: hypothetical protein FDZ70_00420 [Actinobacteria bacterium]|nr:MAG: hypothetical protein FDZ70_00420 [Actinomycetota bacterium]